MFLKSDVLKLMDLTSLNDEDSDNNIITLCEKSTTPLGNVAAICIYKEFIPVAKKVLLGKLPIATVINFPKGKYNLDATLKELEISLNNGADEIDLVMPYQLIIEGKHNQVEDFVSKIKKNCNKKTLKVIIESGVLEKEELIRVASKISINAGADFIKTSTGKVSINATLGAAKYMMEEIKLSNTNCGFKAAGGIKTFEEALKYLELAKSIMGKNFINSQTFRFGASSLLDNLLDKTTNKDNY